MQTPVAGRKLHQTVTILLIAVFLDFPAFAEKVAFPSSSLTLDGRRYSVELATSEMQLEHGLMYRKHLAPDHGMLFIFPKPEYVRMWMKNTPLPLDMLFIDEGGKILSITENTIPESEAVITSEHPAKAVLELAAGTCEKQGINVGDKVNHAVFAARPAH